MSKNHQLVDPLPNWRKSTLSTYATGFVLSVGLTVASFILVGSHASANGGGLSRTVVLVAISLLAVIQLAVQAMFFLHLGSEAKPRWTQMSFWFTVFVALTLVIGSIWIMANLDYNMMPRDRSTEHVLEEEGLRQ